METKFAGRSYFTFALVNITSYWETSLFTLAFVERTKVDAVSGF